MTKNYLPILFLVLLLNSCSKDDGPGGFIPCTADTLATGWTKMPGTSAPFTDIFFRNNNNGIRVGADGMQKSADGGLSWTAVDSSRHFVNCYITPNGNIFAARHLMPMLYGNLNQQGLTTGSIMAIDFHFLDNNTGYTVVRDFNNSWLYSTLNGGANWVRNNHPMPTPLGSEGYASLHFATAAKGWVVCGKLVYQVNNDVIADSVALPVDKLTCVQSLSASTVLAGSGSGEIFKSTNGGASFSPLTRVGTGEAFMDIHFFSEQLGYASNGNKIYYTSDGGQTWQTVARICTGIFAEIHFTDANHGWGVTQNGDIYRFVR
ncbi:MAG: hypothetical protein EOO06_15885 [Chitinophagaceae bacterium]|nr:MAG: hypothetical protein EOO06_15885 [Chitinophagaceae bacterium]